MTHERKNQRKWCHYLHMCQSTTRQRGLGRSVATFSWDVRFRLQACRTLRGSKSVLFQEDVELKTVTENGV
jgi:hypothetical protein